MKIPTRTLLLGIVIVIVLGGCYLYFFSGSGNQAPVSTMTTASADEQQFLSVAAELEPISFNTAIFSDPRFTSLVDITVPVSPDPQGLTDPFAPILGLTRQIADEAF